MRTAAVLLLLVAGFCGRSDGTTPATAQGDTVRTEQPMQLLWNRRVGRAVVVPALAVAGKIVVGSTDGKVQCLDPENGKRLWGIGLKEPLTASPAFAPDSAGHGSIFLAFGERSPRIREVDAKRGKERWTKTAESPALQLWGADGKLWLIERRGFIVCRDAADGAEKWRVRFGGWRPAGFVVKDSTLYALARQDSLLAVDARSGARRWAARLAGPFNAAPVASDSEIVTIAVGGEMTHLDPRTGTIRRKEHRSDGQMLRPALAGGCAVTVTTAGMVEGFGSDTVAWKRDLEDAVQAPPAVMGSEFVIATGTGAVRALARDTGADAWSVKVKGGFRVAPLIVRDNVFLATDRGHVYAYARSQ